MEFPEWSQPIFKNDPEISSPEKLIEQTPTGDTFEDFYQKAVENADKQSFTPQGNRSYSIAEEPYNCEAAATLGAIVGESLYDINLEVLSDFSLGQRGHHPHQRSQQPNGMFQSHVALRDEKGKIYGGSPSEDPKVMPLEKLTGIYLTNMASEARFSEELKDPNHYLDQLSVENKSQYCGASRKSSMT